MKKRLHRVWSALLALFYLLLLTPGTVFAKEADAQATNGAQASELTADTAELAAPMDVYAILYEDGTLVFQNDDTPEDGRSVSETFWVDLEYGYDRYFTPSGSEAITVPWFDVRSLSEKLTLRI